MTAAGDARLAQRIFRLTAQVEEGREGLTELLSRVDGRTDLDPTLAGVVADAWHVVNAVPAGDVPQRWLSVADVAMLTGYSQWTVRRLVRDGLLPARKLPGKSRYLRFAPAAIYRLMSGEQVAS